MTDSETARVVVIGDSHGDMVGLRLITERATKLGIRMLWHVGDLGVGRWSGGHRSRTTEAKLERTLAQFGAELLLTPGNHEDWDAIDSAPLDELGRHVLTERVRALPRGHRWEHGGWHIGSLGGAVSVDYLDRTRGSTWWAQEAPSRADLETLGTDQLDILIAHDAPSGVPVEHPPWALPPEAIACSWEVRELIREAVESTRPEVLLCGHHHQRVTHHLRRTDYGTTRVEMLDMEQTRGNAVVLDLDDLAVEPLADVWRRDAGQ